MNIYVYMCLKNIHFLKSLYCRSKYLNNKQLSDVFHTGIFIVIACIVHFFSVMLASFIARIKYQRINSLFIVTSKYIFFRRGRHLTLLYMTFFTLKKNAYHPTNNTQRCIIRQGAYFHNKKNILYTRCLWPKGRSCIKSCWFPSGHASMNCNQSP